MTIPANLETATSPAWLSGVLGEAVTSVTVGDLDVRLSTNAPLYVETPSGSRALWVKGYFGENSHLISAAGTAEAAFYRDLARRILAAGFRTFQPVYADVDKDTGANLVVTDDETQHGARVLDGLASYSPDQTAESLSQLALLHAESWSDHSLADLSWLDPKVARCAVRRGVTEIEGNFSGPNGTQVPNDVRDAERLFQTFTGMAPALAAFEPWCVIHGDPHIGNLFVDGSGRPGLFDWQLVQRGPWFLDVGYHVAASLDVRARRTHEHDLLRHYLDEMARHGILIRDDRDTAAKLAAGIVYGFFLWAITTKVQPAKIAVLLERLGVAVSDHDAYRRVQKAFSI